MKKRLISLLLTLSMVFSMVPMLGIGVGAIGYSHNASNMCYLIPYAYYANKYSSHEYFIAHYNINGTLNATNLESSFNNSVTTGIANSLDEASWIEKSSEACVQLLQKVFNQTGDFTVTDLYDKLLINMLLDKAATTLSDSTGTIKEIASSTTGLLSTTVKVVDAGGSGVADAISFHQLLTSLGDDGWTAFKNTLKADYFEASNFDIYNIKVGNKTAYVEANVIDNF
ncbi:MAG: hypothetical protein IJX93_00150, partial [Clostridia bacterium]|nr:hypothetical protein [Clostridia bacterium]